jgi:nucleotide-binding universal stress UspA family protein
MSLFPTTMLLATDGSKDAETAAKIASALAESTGSALHVVLVYSWARPSAFDPVSLDRTVHEAVESRARERLEKIVRRIELSGGAVEGSHLEGGQPDAEIVALGEEIGAGLIVVGSRGLGAIRRALIGSVSLSVVRHAHCSVLVVRDSADQEGKRDASGRVLLAYDGSKEASAAAQLAAEIAGATGSEMHLLYVAASEPYPPPFNYVSYEEPGFWEAWEDGLERDEDRARSFVEGQAQRLEARGVKVAQTHLAFGKPDREIVRLAEDLDAGMVVVGNRGRGGMRRTLLGSVSDSVVRHAHCPVMVVRMEKGRA